jgi:GT2 family glycosyltransferase
MRILGHIHTYNDEEVIDQSLEALFTQSHPVDGVIVVDNGSSDGTLSRCAAHNINPIRHEKNLGTSGAVVSGMRYAISHGYDWIWILDADSVPHKHALKNLVDFYSTLPPSTQCNTWLLGTLPIEKNSTRRYHGFTFTTHGFREIAPRNNQQSYQCDAIMWTGSLYKISAIKTLGLPNPNFMLDIGEFEYGYRGKSHGFLAFVHQPSTLVHNIGGSASSRLTHYRIGPCTIRLMELPPIRCYYLIRNLFIFWIYQYKPRTILTTAYCIFKIGKTTMNFALRPVSHWPELSACLKGLFDGLRNDLKSRHES